MEIDPQLLEEFTLWLLDLYYRARSELVAYQVACDLLRRAGLNEVVDRALAESRNNPSPALRADHQKARDTIARILQSEKADELAKFLRDWKAKGPLQ